MAYEELVDKDGTPLGTVSNPLYTTGGGGGGAATIADGADVAQGAKADAAWTSGAGSVIAVLKALAGKIPGLGSAVSASSLPVVIASDQTLKQSPLAAATVPTDAVVSVANTSTSILGANANRASALLKNIDATQTIYLFTGGAATPAKFPLLPGEAITYRHQLAITGIVASGSASLYIVEEQR